MPLPLLFIGIAAATGSVGLGKGIKAGIDSVHAHSINQLSNKTVQEAAEQLNAQREACGRALRLLGEEKFFVLNCSIASFVRAFSRIKNIDFIEKYS